ncbi:MAG: Ca-activated chloride channel family protein [Oleispira sp.]|jgi:Ca-activated chloride channel family protein
MELFFSQFHLLRPLWLLTLIPALVLFILLLKRRLASARWHGIIDESLMPHVLDQMPSEQSRWPLWFILFAWVFSSIALSGPTWEQLPQPVQKKNNALVIVLDMSLSMAAQDVSPDRATRARQKVIDILKQRNEGLTALVVYAGDAYTVTPLTDDADTIINLVPALSPFIMPAMGSRPDKALALAGKLIRDAGLTRAQFLLMTDGIQTKDIGRIEKVLGDKKQQLSILTLGTEEGAPIAMQEGGFKRDGQGNIVLPKLDLESIKQLAADLNIRWHQMSFDDTDWHYLLNINSLTTETLNNSADQKSDPDQTTLERQFDLWADQGYWLILIIIIIAALSFRRGWLLSLAFLIILQPETSYASLWDDAWQTKDQQAQKIFEQDPAKAAEMFEDPNWKASSFYRAKDYQQAAENFSIDNNTSVIEQAKNHFNRGNALAHAGELEKAVKAYEQSLALNNDFSDAEFNKALVEKLLEEQEQQDSDEQQDSNEQQDSDEEQESDEQQDSDDKNSDQQDSDSKDSQEKDSEQQDSEKKDANEKNTEEKNEEKSKSEQEKQAEADKQAEQEQQANQTEAENDLTREEKQALEQWLNRIPDDPGGLLKRKFLYQYKQRDQQDEGEVSW